MNRWKWLRWLVLYPLLFVGGSHTLMTGSPIPLWHIEHLTDPVPVLATTESHLILQGDRPFALPFIKAIPRDNPLFKAAIAHGVEITSDGEAYGLMWSDRDCGNDPVVWRRLRANLSNLAGALAPDGIDPGALHPDWISEIAEHHRIDLSKADRSHDRGHLMLYDWLKMRRVRNWIDEWAEQQAAAESTTK